MQSTDFFFIYQSITDVTLVIFGLTATFYLWQIKDKSTSSWLMFGFFASLTVVFTALFIRIAEYITDPIMLLGAMSAMGFLTQFAYHLPTNDQPKEAKIVLIISTTFVAGVIILAGYINCLIFLGYSLEDAGQLLNLAFFAVPPHLIMVFALFIRRLLHLTPATKQSWWGKLRIALLNPPNPDTRILRNIIGILLLNFAPNVADTLARLGLITIQAASYTVTSGLLLTIFCLFLVYVNYTPQQASFTIKLVSVSLFTILIIFSAVGIIATSFANQRFEIERQINLIQTYYSLQHEEIDFIPNSVGYIFHLSSSQPNRYELIFNRSTELDLEMFIAEDEQRQNYPNLFTPTVDTSATNQFEQSTDTTLVTFRRLLNPLDFYKAKYIAYRFQQNNEVYEIGFVEKPYQQAFHELATQLILLIVVGSLIIIFVFPRFFQIILVNPLNNLLEGIKQADQDHYHKPIPVQYDDEIGFLTRTFNDLLTEKQATIQQLRKADRAKSQFITMMSHELRTPLNAINGFAELLVLGMSGELPETAHHDAQLIYQNGKHLSTLIEDILDMIQIETNDVELTPQHINVEQIIQRVAVELTPVITKKQLAFDYNIATDAEMVWADPLRLKQILFNLIQNSIKFTNQGKIHIDVRSQADKTVLISVQDTGVGIPKPEQERLFEAFQQLDMSDAREHGGTGLGLSICRELVQLHQGNIWLESEEGKGTTVFFSLPIAQSIQVAEGTPL